MQTSFGVDKLFVELELYNDLKLGAWFYTDGDYAVFDLGLLFLLVSFHIGG